MTNGLKLKANHVKSKSKRHGEKFVTFGIFLYSCFFYVHFFILRPSRHVHMYSILNLQSVCERYGFPYRENEILKNELASDLFKTQLKVP